MDLGKELLKTIQIMINRTLKNYKAIVSRFFRKFNFCRLVSDSQPAMLSGSVSDPM